jgi:uncharacterized protein with GYD domain
MPTYYMLLNWTQEGIKNVKDAAKRVERHRSTAKSLGAEIKTLDFVFGKYDMISIVEAPSDEVAAKLSLSIGKYGAARVETLKAFSEAEGYEIIKGLH